MGNKVKPVIIGLNTPISVGLGKRLDWINGNIIFKCPECGNEMSQLDDLADLEYGSFHGFDECWECGVEFDEQYFEVSATVTITLS